MTDVAGKEGSARRRSGLSDYDEIWDGELHPAHAPRFKDARLQAQVMAVLAGWAEQAGLLLTGPVNLGRPDDYRIPDAAVHRCDVNSEWVATAALVVEIVAPDDGTWEKLPYYASIGIDEVLVVDGRRRQVSWLRREGDWYLFAEGSELLGPDSASLAELIIWPY